MLSALEGRVVAVTGASSGIGEAVARCLHAQGALVAVSARRGDRLKDLAEELGHERVLWRETDVRDAEGMQEFFGAAATEFGRLDAVVANAGAGAYGGILDLSDDDVRRLIDTNVTGTVWSVRAAVPHLRHGGDLVLVSSVAGLRGRPDEAVYAATKHAVVGMAGSLDRELRPRGIRVSALCPGATDTEFAFGHGREPGMPKLATMMRAEDVAEAIAYVLCQPPTMRTLMWSMRSMASEN
ncbi:SDR family oxidoreductase [Actinoplanes sp. NPDC026619]|uniref:SDR family oxidoreductase n=1 Tax=Actinoplanes sp. NPDC026619 TaxID=3155798 RepID=UPI0033F26B83